MGNFIFCAVIYIVFDCSPYYNSKGFFRFMQTILIISSAFFRWGFVKRRKRAKRLESFVFIFLIMIKVNTIWFDVPFLYPLKISENQVLTGIQMQNLQNQVNSIQDGPFRGYSRMGTCTKYIFLKQKMENQTYTLVST